MPSIATNTELILDGVVQTINNNPKPNTNAMNKFYHVFKTLASITMKISMGVWKYFKYIMVIAMICALLYGPEFAGAFTLALVVAYNVCPKIKLTLMFGTGVMTSIDMNIIVCLGSILMIIFSGRELSETPEFKPLFSWFAKHLTDRGGLLMVKLHETVYKFTFKNITNFGVQFTKFLFSILWAILKLVLQLVNQLLDLIPLVKQLKVSFGKSEIILHEIQKIINMLTKLTNLSAEDVAETVTEYAESIISSTYEVYNALPSFEGALSSFKGWIKMGQYADQVMPAGGLPGTQTQLLSTNITHTGGNKLSKLYFDNDMNSLKKMILKLREVLLDNSLNQDQKYVCYHVFNHGIAMNFYTMTIQNNKIRKRKNIALKNYMNLAIQLPNFFNNRKTTTSSLKMPIKVMGGKKKKSKKKIRKHKGINQQTGRLKKGYKYSGKHLKTGLPQIIKIKK